MTTMAPAESTPAEIDIAPRLLLENWRGELDAVELYRALGRAEQSEDRKQILEEMAQDEEREREALEWSEATFGDVSDETR